MTPRNGPPVECSRCHRLRGSSFYIPTTTECEDCRKAGRDELLAYEVKTKTQKCGSCHKFVSWDGYSRRSTTGKSVGRHGLFYECRECERVRNRRHHAKTAARLRKSKLGLKDRLDLVVRIDRECCGDPAAIRARLLEVKA